MGRRSAQLTVTDPREDVAKVVYDSWFRYSTDRVDWLQRGSDARAYVTSPTTATTEVGKLPWKNKTTIPKLTQIVDGLVAYYMAALMPADDWFVWEGRDENDQLKADLIEEYMRTKLRMSGFRSELKKILSDWVIYGNAFGGVTWVHEKTKSAWDGSEITNYIGPKLYRISPVDCTVDPRANSFDNSPLIERAVVSIGDIVRHNEEVAAPKYDDVAVQKLIDTRSNGHTRQNFVDFYKESGLQIDGFDSIDTYLDSGLIEIITYWGDIWVTSTGELLRNRVITVADGAVVLRNEENPAWNGKKPFAMATWRNLPDNLYGQSPIDNLLGMQYRCDHLENLKADAFDQIIHPVVVIKGDSGEDYQWAPGAKWYVPVDGDVQPLRPDTTVLVADNQIALYHSYMEQMAGVPREMMGFRTPGEKTAFEVQMLQQGADRQFIDKTNQFEECFIQPILNIMFELLIRNLNIEDVARTFNDDVGALQITTITKEDVVADGNLRPVGSKHYEQRNKRMQELQTLLTLASQTNIGLHISGKNAASMIADELGWTKWGVIKPFAAIEEQALAQVQTQQYQQLLQQSGEQPTGPGQKGPQEMMEQEDEIQ